VEGWERADLRFLDVAVGEDVADGSSRGSGME
jgi:hypothetical protein